MAGGERDAGGGSSGGMPEQLPPSYRNTRIEVVRRAAFDAVAKNGEILRFPTLPAWTKTVTSAEAFPLWAWTWKLAGSPARIPTVTVPEASVVPVGAARVAPCAPFGSVGTIANETVRPPAGKRPL